jgi:hypothetical protein
MIVGGFCVVLTTKISHLISKQISTQNQNSRFVFTKQRTSQQWVSFFSFSFAQIFCDIVKVESTIGRFSQIWL